MADDDHITTSYSQNGEDIVLARGLPGPIGFYVDIGAFDPDVESVTKLFYDRGWRGINVDPIDAFVDRFHVERPRDINVCAAIGAVDGEIEIFVSPSSVPGHSTLDADVAEAHASEGQPFVAKTVRSLRLDSLLELYLPPGQTIDFLKVDVEGAEAAVLASWTPSKFPARVVVVESVAPHRAGSPHHEWEPQLFAAGYRFVLFDGLNRFYVAADDDDLGEVIGVPANLFDLYETPATSRLRAYSDTLEHELRDLHAWAMSLSERVLWLEQRLAATGATPATPATGASGATGRRKKPAARRGST